MAQYQIYTMPEHKTGTGFLGVQFAYDSHKLGVTLSKVELITKTEYGLSSTVAGEITITDAANWVYRIPAQVISWPPGVYSYQIHTTDSAGEELSHIRGTWTIVD